MVHQSPKKQIETAQGVDLTEDNINAIAARVISIEADALHQMAGDLPADFAGAVDAILQTKGRVIVSGVGKSGHIGNKIAATLASTGTWVW